MNDAIPDSTDAPVVFRTARTPIEAELIASILHDAEIPAFVAGGLLADEFAMSQRLMNLSSVAVQVPRSRVQDAEAALAAARAGAASVDEAAARSLEPNPVPAPTTTPGPAAPTRPSWVLTFGLACLTVAFLVEWLDTRAELRVARQAGLTYATNEGPGTLVYRWRDDDRVAGRITDMDGNGIPEVHAAYNRDGEPTNTAYDKDQNGIFERFGLLSAAGNTAAIAYDDDQDGRVERIEEERGASSVVFVDADRDRRCERIEQRDRSGKLVRAWVWRDDGGFVPAR